ncbi:MAG: Nif3-like dinuclear metal center hexameric protein [Akkermansiaceae bacterium]
MATLDEIVEFLNKELRISEIPDYPGAHNGLQLQNEGRVEKIAVAVDASLPVVRKAVAHGVDLLIVHHGMFWHGVKPLSGSYYDKIKEAINGGLAIYSSHLPLDIHPTLGNNVRLAQALELKVTDAFMEWKGHKLGVSGTLDLSLSELRERLSDAVGGAVLSCGPEDAPSGRVGIITGGAGSEIEKVAASGIETFITGEGPHWSYPLAEELGLNFLYGGHYATETFGVRALGDALIERFQVESRFIDHPTGL